MTRKVPGTSRALRQRGGASEGALYEGGSESAREPDPKHNREAPDLIFQGHSLAH
jgi:hypothetical protein